MVGDWYPNRGEKGTLGHQRGANLEGQMRGQFSATVDVSKDLKLAGAAKLPDAPEAARHCRLPICSWPEPRAD